MTFLSLPLRQDEIQALPRPFGFGEALGEAPICRVSSGLVWLKVAILLICLVYLFGILTWGRKETLAVPSAIAYRGIRHAYFVPLESFRQADKRG